MRSRATRRRVARKISTPTLHSKERDVTLSSVVEKGDRAGKLNEKKRTKRRRKAKNISRGRETEGEKERERRRKMRETSTGREEHAGCTSARTTVWEPKRKENVSEKGAEANGERFEGGRQEQGCEKCVDAWASVSERENAAWTARRLAAPLEPRVSRFQLIVKRVRSIWIIDEHQLARMVENNRVKPDSR